MDPDTPPPSSIPAGTMPGDDPLPALYSPVPQASHPSNDPPPSLVSPSITPPSTPSVPVDTTGIRTPNLLHTLPRVTCVVRARIPTTAGTEMFLHLYHNNVDDKEHLAIVFGNQIRSRSLDAPRPGETEMDRMIRGAYTGRLFPGRTTSRDTNPTYSTSSAAQTKPAGSSATTSSSSFGNDSTPAQPQSTIPLVRIHSECYTGETAWSARCDCGEQLDEAARLMSLENCAPSSISTTSSNIPTPNDTPPHPSGPGGVIIYLRQEGRGIGLLDKLKAYNLQDLGSDTVEANLLLRHPADARSYGLATAMLLDLGLGGARGIRLLTNNPDKVRAVEGPNREVVVRERVAMVPLAWRTGGKEGVRSEEVGGYLRTKIEKMGHMLQMGS